MSVVWEACDNGVPSLGYPQKFHEAQKLLTFVTETWQEENTIHNVGKSISCLPPHDWECFLHTTYKHGDFAFDL